MVQIIPRAQPTFGEQIAGGLQSGYQKGEQFGQQIGRDVLAHKHRQKELQSKLTGDVETQQKTINMLNKYFGPEAAEVYPHLTEGGKTALFQSLLLGKERGENASNVLTEYFNERPEELENIYENINQPAEETPRKEPIEPRGLSSKAEEELTKKGIQESEKYLGEAREKYHRAQTLKPVFDELRNSVVAGGTSAFSGGNLADIGQKMGGFFGTIIHSLGKALESKETGKFRTLSKKLLDEMKDIFGGQIRVKELEVFLSMLPEIGKSKEANLASIDILEKLSQASTMFYDTAQEIIQQNNGRIPKNLADQVQKRLKPVLSDLSKDITNSTRRFEKENKTLTKELASEILREAQGDRELARKIAKQKGYKF